MAPDELSADIEELYNQLREIPEFETETCRKAFPGFLEKVRRLHGFNQVQSYKVVFIGEPGMGKTTAICNWLGLLRADKVKAQRIDKVSLLATASGRTTVAEVHIRQVHGPSRLRFDYMPLEQQKAYIRDYSDYYYQTGRGITVKAEETEEADSTKSDTHIEMDRVVRNMAGLQDIQSGDSERAIANRTRISSLISGFRDSDSFYNYVLKSIDLESRQCPVIEKRPDESFETWLSKTFRDVNDGKHPKCSIANVIYVDISTNDLDLMLPDYIAEVIDTKGLDSAAAARMDLQKLMRADDTVCFVIDDVKGVPSDNVRNLLKRTYLNELDAYYKCKTSIFVKSPDDELAGVNGADGDPETGADLKASEIHRRVDADSIPYYVDNTVFLDSCAAYIISTIREPVFENGMPVIDQRTNRQKTKLKKAITDFDDDAADIYRSCLTNQIIKLIEQLRNRLESDAQAARDGVARLLEIERKATNQAAMKELAEAKATIEENRDSLIHRFRRREVVEAILDSAIDRIHWATIRKMNSLYGAYEMWHTDIYTQIMQAGRECFADLIRPMSNFVHRTLDGIENKEANSIASGYLNQFDQMVKDSTDDIGETFLHWALDDEFAPQDDSNRFWVIVNQRRGRGYKNMVRNDYYDHIDDDAGLMAKAVDKEANKVIDNLLSLLSEEPSKD